MIFYVGIPEPAWASRFHRCFISIARLRRRKGPFRPPAGGWAMDSAAFTEVALNGGYRQSPEAFAEEAQIWCDRVAGCDFVASQNFMCEPFVLQRTGLSLHEHQRLTIERYDRIRSAWRSDVQLMPVLQGFAQVDYLRHLEDYGNRLAPGMRVGVGSICKRQGSVALVEDLLGAIAEQRPDLRLHGFGVKLTALQSPLIRDLLATADSMAWSFSARKQGRNPNDWREAETFAGRVDQSPPAPAQTNLWGWA